MYPAPIDSNTGNTVSPPSGIEWNPTKGYFDNPDDVTWDSPPTCYKTQSDYNSQLNPQNIERRDARYILASG